MILVDRDIIERANHFGRSLVVPFDAKHVTPNGYDLSLKEIKIGKDTILDINDGNLVIPAKTSVVGMSEERVEMSKNMVGFLWIRSSYGRKGLILMASVVDAGYCGNLALSLYNSSNEDIIIPRDGKRTICQIVFEQLESTPTALYAQRSGNYQGQKSLKESL